MTLLDVAGYTVCFVLGFILGDLAARQQSAARRAKSERLGRVFRRRE